MLFHQHHRFRRRERKTSQELNSTRCEWNVEKYYNRQWRGKTWNENKRMKQQCPPRRFSIRIGSQEESIDRPFHCSFLFSSRSLIVKIAAQSKEANRPSLSTISIREERFAMAFLQNLRSNRFSDYSLSSYRNISSKSYPIN